MMNSISNPLRKMGVLALLAIATTLSVSAHGQQDSGASANEELPVSFPFGAPDFNVEEVLGRVLSADDIDVLRKAGAEVRTEVVLFKSGNCLVTSNVGAKVPAQLTKAPRVTSPLASAMSEIKPGENEFAACRRALASSLEKITGGAPLAIEDVYRRVKATLAESGEPPKPEKRVNGRVFVSHNYTLNQAGVNFVAELLGARWWEVMDHRVFSPSVILFTGKSDGGRNYCAVRYGITTRATGGRAPYLPGNFEWRLMTVNVNEQCEREVITAAMEDFRINYTDMLKDIAYTTERGVKYPTPADIAKRVAKYDADQRKVQERTQARQPKPRGTSSTTTSRNNLSCTNDCVNGSCVRTFPDGRKERWQAPRKFDPFSNNWGWDTTTNACGT